jgi:hypothetical protein
MTNMDWMQNPEGGATGEHRPDARCDPPARVRTNGLRNDPTLRADLVE